MLTVCILLGLSLAVLLGLWIVTLRRMKDIRTALESIARGHQHQVYVRNDGDVYGIGRVVNDLSDHIEARFEELDTHKSRLEATFLSMFDGVMILDAEGNILLINKTLRDFLEITGEVAGHTPIEIIRNQDIQELSDAVLQGEKDTGTREITIFQPHEHTFQVHATPIRRDGIPDGAILVFHDITDLRKLEQVRRDFVANVSHELRTPMTNIKGYSETLLDGALEDPAVAKEFVGIIKNDADRLTQLIDDLLQLAKIESGTDTFDKRLHDLRGVIDNVIRDLGPQSRQRNVTVRNAVSAPVYATFDSRAMTQVLFNLIDNAIKYNQDNGTVTVTVNSENDRVIISIVDTGVGIPPEDLPRIFERFYRVDKAHSRKIDGTGLGLSIVKHIIQLHGGEIHVQSELNRGTTFRVTLFK